MLRIFYSNYFIFIYIYVLDVLVILVRLPLVFIKGNLTWLALTYTRQNAQNVSAACRLWNLYL